MASGSSVPGAAVWVAFSAVSKSGFFACQGARKLANSRPKNPDRRLLALSQPPALITRKAPPPKRVNPMIQARAFQLPGVRAVRSVIGLGAPGGVGAVIPNTTGTASARRAMPRAASSLVLVWVPASMKQGGRHQILVIVAPGHKDFFNNGFVYAVSIGH